MVRRNHGQTRCLRFLQGKALPFLIPIHTHARKHKKVAFGYISGNGGAIAGALKGDVGAKAKLTGQFFQLGAQWSVTDNIIMNIRMCLAQFGEGAQAELMAFDLDQPRHG